MRGFLGLGDIAREDHPALETELSDVALQIGAQGAAARDDEPLLGHPAGDRRPDIQ